MLFPFIHYPAGDAPSRDSAVRAPSREAARDKLADALDVPAWTLRPLGSGPTPPAEEPAGWRVTHYRMLRTGLCCGARGSCCFATHATQRTATA